MAMAATSSSSSSSRGSSSSSSRGSSSHASFSFSLFQECTKAPSVMDAVVVGEGDESQGTQQHAEEVHGGGLGVLDSCIGKVGHASFDDSPDSSSAATDSSSSNTDQQQHSGCKQQSSDEKKNELGFEGGKVKVEAMENMENTAAAAAAWQANGSSTHDEWLLSRAVEKLQPLGGINSFYNTCCLLPEEEEGGGGGGGGEVFGNIIQVQLEENHDDFYLNDEDPAKMMGSWNPNEWDTEAFCEQKNMPQLGIPAGDGKEARMETDHACSQQQQQQILRAAWDPFSKQQVPDGIMESNSSRGISFSSNYNNDPTGFYGMSNALGAAASFMGGSADAELQQNLSTICLGSDSLLQMPLAMVVSGNSVADMRPGTPAATTRAARKSRMARKRRSAVKPVAGTSPWSSPAAAQLLHHATKPSAAAAAAAAAGEQPHHKLEDTAHVLLEKNLKFLLQKQLKPSDVGNLGRIVLPKKEAESRLPYLSVREGIILVMDDLTTPRKWNLRYRFWPNNKSRMYLLENTGEFVKSHRLCEGDFLLLYKDSSNGNYVIYGKKAQGASQNGEKRELPGTKQQGVKRAKSLDSERKSSSKVGSTTNKISNSEAEAAAAAAAAAEAPFVLEGGTGLEMLDHFPLLESSDLAIDEILELVDMPAAE